MFSTLYNTAHVVLASAAEAVDGVTEVAQQPNPMIPALKEVVWGAATFFTTLLIMVTVGVPRVQRVMDERAKRIADDLDAAERAETDAARAQAQYNEAIHAARVEASRIIDVARHEALAIANERKASVEAELATAKSSHREAVSGAKDRAGADIGAEVNELAVDLAQAAVGQPFDKSAQMSFLAKYSPSNN
jgi:F-type H+-transporting ATPase subunit b